MPNETAPMSTIADPAQPWVERVSGLEEEIRNLRRLQLTIERNNTLFEALLASSRDGIALTRLDGTIIKVVRAILGYARELSGISAYDFVYEDDRERVRAAYQLLSHRRKSRAELEVRMIRPDKSLVWAEVSITDMLDNPAVQAIVLNYRDITQLRASELAAAELEVVIRFAPFAIFSGNLAGEILSWNERARELFGHEHHEIIGRPIWTLVPRGLREEEQRRRFLAIERGTASEKIRTTALRKDGSYLALEIVLSPIVAAGRVRGLAQLSYPVDPPC